MKIFVTCSKGFVIKALIKNLLSKPCEVKELVCQSSMVMPGILIINII
mgnify:CR=1 FL=1